MNVLAKNYMPSQSERKAGKYQGDPTMIFDTFVVVNRRDPLFIGWPNAELSAESRAVLSRLLGNLSSLGRAESWVQAELFDATIDLPLGLASASDPNPVPVFCPDPSTAFGEEHYPTLDPKKLATGKVKPPDFLFDCPRWHLCLDTETLHNRRWPMVPGAMWVNYTRPLETTTARARSKSRERPAPSLARFALDGPVLPLVTETLPLAEQARRALLSKCKVLALRDQPGLADADIWRRSPAFWGKEDDGRPRTGHQHAFFLPADEDGDGRLDHLTVFAPMGFNSLECLAIHRLRQLPLGDGDPLRLLLIGLANPDDFRSLLLAESNVWTSATPFIVTRYPKLKGTKRDQPEDYASPRVFAGHVLRQELARRPDLPPVEAIEMEDVIGPHRLRPIQFKRFRSKRGDDGGRRPAGGFRITFTSPVRGPLCLGHSCHFGLGLFAPVSPSPPATRAMW
jgi:CRISPR-associated protein Csb2